MDECLITKPELDAAINAVDNILKQPVDEINLSDTIPVSGEVTDSNSVFKGKLSILFVDIRKSTDLTDELRSKKMVKIYRSFIRMAIQAIRYSGGYTRQFAGDGVMGVFQDSADPEQAVASSKKAITAARYIHTLIDFCLNPALKKQFGDICIGCGIGICTGVIMITKVGMRGKEADKTAESETGIVWVGSTTNYADSYCSLSAPGEIFIDEKTYSEIDQSKEWKSVSRAKERKAFVGYAASRYYLLLPDDFEQKPVKSDGQNSPDVSFVKSIFSETQECAMGLIDEISKISAELSLALETVRQREQRVVARENEAGKENIRLQNWHQRLDLRQTSVDEKDAYNKIKEYEIHCSIFFKTFCKPQVIKEYGIDYWLSLIETAYKLGAIIGKSKLQVQIDLACYLVDVYICFGLFKEAYDMFCIQAQYSSWLSTYQLEEIVNKSGHWARLKGILEARIHDKKDYFDALQKLKAMGY